MTDTPSLPALREAVATIAQHVPYAAVGEHHDHIIQRMVAVDIAKQQLLDAAPALLDEVAAAKAELAAVLAEREAFDQRWEQLHMFIVNLPSSQYTVDAVAYYMRQLEREVL